jgi:hypothetical protein
MTAHAPADFAAALIGRDVLLRVQPRPDIGAVELLIRDDDAPLRLMLAGEHAYRLGERLLDAALAAGWLLPRERAP